MDEAEIGGDLADALFVDGVAIRVQQANGERIDASRAEGPERGAGSGFIEWAQDGAVGGEAFGDFDRGLVEFGRLDDVQIEEMRAILIADAQGVGKTGSCDESDPRDAAFEERIGGAGGAQADAYRADGLVEPVAKEPADAGDGSFFVREEFAPRALGGSGGKCRVKSQRALGGIEGGDQAGDDAFSRKFAGKAVAIEVAAGRMAQRGGAEDIGGASRISGDGMAARTKQFVSEQSAIGQTGDAIGKRSADIDPELRSSSAHSHGHGRLRPLRL